MARRARIHRRVEVDTWQSHDFLALSAAKPNAQTLWLWLLTCERTIIIPGVIVARPAVMADDLRWPLRAFERCLAEIEAAGMVEIDREVGLVVLSKALVVGDAMRDGAGPAGENAAKSWATALQKLKPCALRDTLTARVQLVISQCGEKISNAFAEAMAMPCARQADAVSDAKRTQGSGIRDQGSGIRESEIAAPPAPPPPAKPSASTDPGYATTIATFDAAYVAQTGSKPTWGAKQGAMVKRLIAAQGAAETQARIRRLFAGAIAAWCHPPYDLGTLVQHFDKLANVAAAPVAAPRPSQQPLKGLAAGLAIDPSELQ